MTATGLRPGPVGLSSAEATRRLEVDAPNTVVRPRPRATRTPGGERNPGLIVAVAVSAVLQLAGVFVPPLRHLLGTSWLTPGQLFWCLAAGVVPAALLVAARRLGGPLGAVRGSR